MKYSVKSAESNLISLGDKDTQKENDILAVEKLIKHKYPKQLRAALLKYGYIRKDGDEYLGIREGLSPEKQDMYDWYWTGMYSWGAKLDKVYFPFSTNDCGDYLCVDEHDKLYEFIHDKQNHIVEFSKEYKNDIKDFNTYLNQVIFGNKDYYGYDRSSESISPKDIPNVDTSKAKVQFDETGHRTTPASADKNVIEFIKKNSTKIFNEIVKACFDFVTGKGDWKYFLAEDLKKDPKDITKQDIIDSIELKNFKLFQPNEGDKWAPKNVWFSICFECKWEEEHGCGVRFDKSGKAVDCGFYSDMAFY